MIHVGKYVPKAWIVGVASLRFLFLQIRGILASERKGSTAVHSMETSEKVH